MGSTPTRVIVSAMVYNIAKCRGKLIHLKQWEGSSSIDLYARAPLVGTGAK